MVAKNNEWCTIRGITHVGAHTMTGKLDRLLYVFSYIIPLVIVVLLVGLELDPDSTEVMWLIINGIIYYLSLRSFVYHRSGLVGVAKCTASLFTWTSVAAFYMSGFIALITAAIIVPVGLVALLKIYKFVMYG